MKSVGGIGTGNVGDITDVDFLDTLFGLFEASLELLELDLDEALELEVDDDED